MNTAVLVILAFILFSIALTVALIRLFRLGDEVPDAGESYEASGPDGSHGGD